jgi:hypothetical protein
MYAFLDNAESSDANDSHENLNKSLTHRLEPENPHSSALARNINGCLGNPDKLDLEIYQFKIYYIIAN